MPNRVIFLFFITIMAILLTACSSPEEKKMKFFNKGKALYDQGDYVRARLEIKNALQIDPNFAEGYYFFGLVEKKTENLKRAYGAFLKAAELNPNFYPAQLELGKLLLLSRKETAAMEKADLILSAAPENQEAAILKGSVLLAQKDFSAAIQVFEDLFIKGAQNPDVFLLLASAYSRNENKNKAEQVLKVVIEP